MNYVDIEGSLKPAHEKNELREVKGRLRTLLNAVQDVVIDGTTYTGEHITAWVQEYLSGTNSQVTPEVLTRLKLSPEVLFLAGTIRETYTGEKNPFSGPVTPKAGDKAPSKFESVRLELQAQAPEIDIRGWVDVADAIKYLNVVPTENGLREKCAKRLLPSAQNFKELHTLLTAIESPIESREGDMTSLELVEKIKIILKSPEFQSEKFRNTIRARDESLAASFVLEHMPLDFTNRFSLRETVARCVVTDIKAKQQ